MRITTKGQVTIPQDIREAAGLLPNTEVEFVHDGDLVYLVKAEAPKKATRGQRAVAALRQQGTEITMTTDELLALLRPAD